MPLKRNAKILFASILVLHLLLPHFLVGTRNTLYFIGNSRLRLNLNSLPTEDSKFTNALASTEAYAKRSAIDIRYQEDLKNERGLTPRLFGLFKRRDLTIAQVEIIDSIFRQPGGLNSFRSLDVSDPDNTAHILKQVSILEEIVADLSGTLRKESPDAQNLAALRNSFERIQMEFKRADRLEERGVNDASQVRVNILLIEAVNIRESISSLRNN